MKAILSFRRMMASLGPWGFFSPQLSNLLEIQLISSMDKDRVFSLFSSSSQLSFILIKLGVLCLAQSSIIQAMVYSVAATQCVCTGQSTVISSLLRLHLSLRKVYSSNHLNSSVSCRSAKTALAKKSQTVIGNPTSLESPDTTNISSLATYSKKEYFVFSWRRGPGAPGPF